MTKDRTSHQSDLRLVFDRQRAERRAIRAELAALAVRAREADMMSLALVLDLAIAVEVGDGAPW